MGSVDGSSSDGSLSSFEDREREVWRLVNDLLGIMGFSATKVAKILVLYSSLDLVKSGKYEIIDFKHFYDLYALFWI